MKKKIIYSSTIIAIIGMMIIASLALSGGISNANAAPDASKENVLVVYGEGKVSIDPDIAYINVGVETLDKDAKKAQDTNKSTMDKVIAKLKSLKIDDKDIKTVNYSVNQDIDYSNNKREVRGFIVSNSVRVTIKDINKVGEVINAAYNEGANNIYGISFDVKDKDAAYKEALQKAIDSAKSKAEVMAKQAGVSIQKPLGIYEGLQSQPMYRDNMNLSMEKTALMDAAGVSVSPGEMEIQANVTIEYKY